MLQAEFGFAVWQSFRDRLIGFVTGHIFWDKGQEQWGYTNTPSNQFSVVLSGMLFFHKYIVVLRI